jgi:hypothetical protein
VKLVFRLAVLAVVVFGIYGLYQTPSFHSQLDQVWRNLISGFNQIEETVSQEVGPTGGIASKSVEVAVPKSRALDWQPVGALGRSILGGSNLPVKIEIDYTVKSKPTASDQAVLGEVIRKYSGKEVVTDLDTGNIPPSDNYTLQDIVVLTKTYRGCYTTSTQVCLYALFLPGKFEGSTALGASFTSSATSFFTDQIARGANFIVSRDRIATATITHELGHLFGLINLTYHSPRDHEDSSHPGHSTNSKSVMYWAVEDLSISSILSGGPGDSFDADDEADILDIKAGKI